VVLPDQYSAVDAIEAVGDGAQGQVWRVQRTEDGVGSGTVLALKVCPRTCGNDAQRWAMEARIMETLMRAPHENVVAVLDAPVVTPTSGCVAMELYPMDLVTVLQRWVQEAHTPKTEDGSLTAPRLSPVAGLPVDVVASLLLQCAAGLDHCARLGVFHMDVKPENVCLASDGRAKLLDFGCGLMVDVDGDVKTQDLPRNACPTATACKPGSTVMYRAPETASGLVLYDVVAADVWSLGLTTLVCLAAQPLWMREDARWALWQTLWDGEMHPVADSGFERVCRDANRDGTPVSTLAEGHLVVRAVLDSMVHHLLVDLGMQGLCGGADPHLLRIIVLMLCPVPRCRPSLLQLLCDPWLQKVKASPAAMRPKKLVPDPRGAIADDLKP
jgi:serine/threonine protein kinase